MMPPAGIEPRTSRFLSSRSPRITVKAANDVTFCHFHILVIA